MILTNKSKGYRQEKSTQRMSCKEVLASICKREYAFCWCFWCLLRGLRKLNQLLCSVVTNIYAHSQQKSEPDQAQQPKLSGP